VTADTKKSAKSRATIAQEARLVRHLVALGRAADRLRAFDRLDAQLLGTIVSIAAGRVKNVIGDEPWWPAQVPTTIRDMTGALEAISGDPRRGWWTAVDDGAPPGKRMNKRRVPRTKKAEAMRAHGEAILRSILSSEPDGAA
jgi:hypothetical protein